jgi:hypothetical protein
LYYPPPTVLATRHKFRGDFDHIRKDTPDPARARAAAYLFTQIYFYAFAFVNKFFYFALVAPHYYGAIPKLF